jgi:hypothetical protein
VIVTRQPSRQIVGRIQVRQDALVEGGQFVLIQQSFSLTHRDDTLIYRKCDDFIPEGI